MKNFIDISACTLHDLETFFVRAELLKSYRKSGISFQPLLGKSVALYFEKPSLRTKVSFDIGVQELGGITTSLDYNMIALGMREPVKDVARTLQSYVDAIVCRIFSHEHLYDLTNSSKLHVINALTDFSHPCQILADILTLRELNLWRDHLTLVWVGDPNNVLQSWLEIAEFYPIQIIISCPELPHEFSHWLTKPTVKGKVSWEKNPKVAVSSADVIYLDTWISMGQEQFAEQKRYVYHGYSVTEKLLSFAPEHVQVMHCLPAKRGEEVDDSVMERFSSLIFQQAENRLHIQKAILWELLAPHIPPVSKSKKELFSLKS